MIGKYTTESKAEARKNKDLIYLDKRVLNSIRIPIIKRCNYCNLVLSAYDGNNKYCSTWCQEMGNTKHLELVYTCKKCSRPTPYGVYVCDKCKESKKHKESKIRIKKEKDLVGHLCKKCGVYQEWSNFSLVYGKHKTRCKNCCAKEYLDYYNKNKEKISLEHKEYYNKNKYEKKT